MEIIKFKGAVVNNDLLDNQFIEESLKPWLDNSTSAVLCVEPNFKGWCDIFNISEQKRIVTVPNLSEGIKVAAYCASPDGYNANIEVRSSTENKCDADSFSDWQSNRKSKLVRNKIQRN